MTGFAERYAIQGTSLNVLDCGFIRLVDFMGDDLSIIRAARVSYDAAWRTGENEANDDKLLKRLWTGGSTHGRAPAHSTPFESVVLTFEVKAPIFVFRQWHRHRTQSYNELSLRYKEVPGDEYYIPDPDVVGAQATNNKQGRQGTDDETRFARRAEIQMMYQGAIALAFERYHELLEAGWPRELARCVLPLATYSHMFTTGNLLNFLRFLSLRADPHAQWEIRVYANAMAHLLELVVPRTMALWREGNPNIIP